MGNPTWMYRKVDGKLESVIFDSDDKLTGWYDSPDKVKITTAEEWQEPAGETPVVKYKKPRSRKS